MSAAAEARPRRRRAQQAVLADHGQLELARDEPLAQRGRHEVDARGQAEADRRGRPVLAQLFRVELGDDEALHAIAGPRGLAGVAEGDEHAVAVVGQAAQVALGGRDVAPGRLRPGGVELHALLALHELDRHRVRQQAAHLEQRQVELFAQLSGQGHRQLRVESGQRAHHVVGTDRGQAHGALLADAGEVDEAPRQARQGARLGAPVGVVGSLVAAGELPRGELLRDGGLHLVAGRVDLGGRRHEALLDLGDGALREHREAAQRLDRVAPELDAHRDRRSRGRRRRCRRARRTRRARAPARRARNPGWRSQRAPDRRAPRRPWPGRAGAAAGRAG